MWVMPSVETTSKTLDYCRMSLRDSTDDVNLHLLERTKLP
jgi:hypothetical protein